MAWIRRNGDGALFEVFGTHVLAGRYTKFFVYLTQATAFLEKGWQWVPAEDFKPLKAVNISEAEQAGAL